MTKRPSPAPPVPAKLADTMSAGQMAYEQRRAAEAGLSLEAWLKKKSREEAGAASPSPAAKSPARKGLFTRLLDRAHKPLKG